MNYRGNGGRRGCAIGRKSALGATNSLQNHDGCLRHSYVSCLSCPRVEQGLDCDYNYTIEQRIRKELNDKAGIEQIQP